MRKPTDRMPPAGWAKRLPMPVEVLAGRRRKVLRTLADARRYVLEDLPPDVANTRVWQGVASALIEAAEPEGRTSRAEVALRMARMMTPKARP